MENCMEVVIDRDAFVKGLQMVQNIVEPRQTLPILANVLLEADGEAVRVTATDLEVGARVAIPAKVASKGAITVSARKLGEIVKELPAAAVALRVTDNVRSEEHTSELQSRLHLVCRLLLEKKKKENRHT